MTKEVKVDSKLIRYSDGWTTLDFKLAQMNESELRVVVAKAKQDDKGNKKSN